MIAISTQGLGKSFGIHDVLKNITVTIQQGERIGIVGVNGCGKTTLMNILAGQLVWDTGTLSMAKGMEIGYVAQQDMLDTGNPRTVWEELSSVYEPVFRMEEKLRQMEADMAHAPQDSSLFGEYDHLMERFTQADGYAWKSMVLGVLNGLGFTPEQHHQPLRSLSGGERARLFLGKTLLMKPQVLLLDEPTNHLDMDTLQWLENYLCAYPGTVLVISHDRYFLDNVCTGIVEIIGGVSEQYSGNYTRYLQQRSERYEAWQRAYALQQKEIERQKAIIARYRMFNREKSIRAAESREKALNRMERIDRPVESRNIRLSFHARKRTGEDVLLVEGLGKRYGTRQLFEGLNLHVRAGDRIAVIGPNGVGKTTLMRMILGQEMPDEGSVRFGANVEVGYYDQHQAGLHPEKDILDDVWDRFPQMEQSDVRGALGMFLFTGDDVFQKISTLSGGEKGRVALTELMLQQNNVLLLDEPTNHLDMDSREVLEDALEDFEGTILTVSHDRYFINRIANRIIEMMPGQITEYLGNYNDYLEKKNQPREEIREAGKTRTELDKEKKKERMSRLQVRRVKAELQETEKKISALEEELSQLEERMGDPGLYADSSKAEQVQKRYSQVRAELDPLYELWENTEQLLAQLSEDN